MKKRFFKKYTQLNFFGLNQHIFVDKTTGVHYLYMGNSYCCGSLTPLLDKEGKPTITREDIE